MERNDCYTYTHAYPDDYPDKQLVGTVFYVGKGTGDRIDFHEKEARRGVQSPKCDIIRSIWDAGCQVAKKKEQEHLTSSEAEEQEALLVMRLGQSTLANRTRKGGAGRPVGRKGNYERITLEVRSDLLAKIKLSGKSYREVVEIALDNFYLEPVELAI